MKVLKLSEAHDLLKKAKLVLVNKRTIALPTVNDLLDDPESNFMYLEWEDGINGYCTLSFSEGDNQEVAVSETAMFLYHTESENEYDNVKINILSMQELENK